MSRLKSRPRASARRARVVSDGSWSRLQPGDARLAHAKLLGELRLGKAMADPVPDYFGSDVVGELCSLVLAPVLRILHRLLVLGVRAHRLRKLCHGLHPSSFPSSRYFS